MKDIEEIEKALGVIAKAKNEGIKAFDVLISEDGYSGKHTIVYPRIKVGYDDYEFIYSLNENYMSEVCALKVGESMYFQPNRDDDKSKGIITRIM